MTAYGTSSVMAVPPSLASSAVTPTLRPLTSAMNAGGNDHSRPTSNPTFMTPPTSQIADCRLKNLVLLAVQSENCNPSSAIVSSIVPADVGPDHLLPVRPVVRPAVPE